MVKPQSNIIYDSTVFQSKGTLNSYTAVRRNKQLVICHYQRELVIN